MDRNQFDGTRGLIFSAVGTACIAAFDFATNQELLLGQMFAIPVVLAAWASGWRWGLLFAVLSCALLFFTPIAFARGYETRIYKWIDPALTLTSFAVFAWIGDRLRQARSELIALSRRDGLTGLANRVALMDSLDAEIERHRRSRKSFALVFIDCDNFKEINDRHGHAAGDLALRSYASRMLDRLRTVDLVARFGGDEFVVILPDTGRNDAQRLAIDLKERIEKEIAPDNLVARCSMGVAVFDRMPNDSAAAISFADETMYASKRTGNNGITVAIYSEGIGVG